MESIQLNEISTVNYLLKLIPDFTVFDIAESACCANIGSAKVTFPKIFNDFFYYDPEPFIENTNGSLINDMKRYTIRSDFRRAIFKFSFSKYKDDLFSKDFTTILPGASHYNMFPIDKGSDKYMVIIDERGDANGHFEVLINNYYSDSLQSVIGVCF